MFNKQAAMLCLFSIVFMVLIAFLLVVNMLYLPMPDLTGEYRVIEDKKFLTKYLKVTFAPDGHYKLEEYVRETPFVSQVTVLSNGGVHWKQTGDDLKIWRAFGNGSSNHKLIWTDENNVSMVEDYEGKKIVVVLKRLTKDEIFDFPPNEKKAPE